MSGVDKRVVEMQFDNAQFEKNTQTSIKTLDNLKKGLNLDASAKSLSNLNAAGKSFSLAGMSQGVDTLVSRFSTLGIVGITAIQNITNAAINAGVNMVKSLTIDPISAGLTEYETKLNSITTILTNTKSKGTTLDEVNAALAELNTYSDQTIYNFAEMARNIGTFTAAGVGLDASVSAIKGIANLAAGSGSSALQASTAMYQLSQALASGSVKLMDWNSVVNAGMGGELFQNALKATAKEMGIVVDTSIPFRETLEKGWLTADVLTKTLARFAEDASLVEAATQVKTMTQLFSTMKESVQSGWAVSWESILGDKDEAAKTFTALNNGFGSLIGPSTDARNAALAFWNANGGRDALIEGLTNVFNGLMAVLKPIGEAFKEVFPGITGERLIEFSNGFKDLTANFKIGEETANRLKSTFKGVFAIVDIGKMAVTALAKGLFMLIGAIFPVTGGLLSVTGGIGDFLVGLDNAIKSSNIFGNVLNTIGLVIKAVADGIKSVAAGIMGVFTGMGKVDTSGLTGISDSIQASFNPFANIGQKITDAFASISEGIKKATPGMYAFGQAVSKVFGGIKDSIAKGLSSGNGKELVDLLNAGLFAAILLAIKSFIKSLTGFVSSGGGLLSGMQGVFGGITGILDGVRGCLVAYQAQLKANVLMTIAISIGILAAALVALSLIDSEKLTVALAAISALFIELFASMAIFNGAMGKAGFLSMVKIAVTMNIMSVSVLLLAFALSKLAKLDWKGIAVGLTGVAGLAIILVGVAKVLSSSSPMMLKGTLGLIAFAVALNLLVGVVKKLGAMDPGSLAKGLGGIAVLLLELVVFMKLSQYGKLGISTGLGLMVLAVALNILARAIGVMGEMSLKEIGKGLLALAGALGIIAGAMRLMPKGMLIQSLVLTDVAVVINLLAKALQTLGSLSPEEMAKSLTTLAVSLGIIIGALKLMTGELLDSTALILVMSSLLLLAAALKILGSMSMDEIGKSLLVLAGALGIIVLAAVLIGPVIPALLALGAAMLLIGVACLAMGVGLGLVAAGLSALALAASAGAAGITLIFGALIGLLPSLFTKLGESVIAFAGVIATGGPAFVDAITTLILSICEAIVNTTPTVIESLFNFLETMLKMLIEYVPKLMIMGTELILGLLKGISDNITKVTEAGIEVIVQFLAGVAEKLPDIIQSAFDVIIAFINGLADAIRNNHEAIYSAVGNLISAIIEAITSLNYKFKQAGMDIIDGFIDGIRSKISAAASWAAQMASSALAAAKAALDSNSPSKKFAELGKWSAEGFAGGLKKYGHLAATEAANVGTTTIDAMKKAVSNISDVINGDMDVNPTIRPVLDLTAVKDGLGSAFDKKQTINVGTIQSRTATISAREANRRTSSDAGINQVTDNSNNGKIEIHNSYSVRNDNDIKKISQDLKNTLNRFNNARGVLVR